MKLTGYDAVAYARTNNLAGVCKIATPESPASAEYPLDDAETLCAVDPALVYVKLRPNKERFKYYQDAEHGWLAVKRTLLEELGILSKITESSYVKGATVYLEEDRDLQTFTAAYTAKFGKEPAFLTIYRDKSQIRNYPSFDLGA